VALASVALTGEKVFVVIASLGVGSLVWGLMWSVGKARPGDTWNARYFRNSRRDIRRGAVLLVTGLLGVLVVHLA
jgi:hypothetical protein